MRCAVAFARRRVGGLRRLIQFGVPVALIAYKVKQSRDAASGNGAYDAI